MDIYYIYYINGWILTSATIKNHDINICLQQKQFIVIILMRNSLSFFRSWWFRRGDRQRSLGFFAIGGLYQQWQWTTCDV